MWMLSLAALALALPLGSAQHARAGGCANFRHYTSGFAARAGSALPANGGVLFVPTLAEGRGDGNVFARRGGEPLESLRRGASALASTREELAPGWVISRPEPHTSGRITAVVAGRQRAHRMTRGDAPTLASTHNPSVQYTPPQRQDTPIGVRTSRASNTLTLGRRPPAGAYAVVVRHAPPAGRAADPDGFAIRIEAPRSTTRYGGNVTMNPLGAQADAAIHTRSVSYYSGGLPGLLLADGRRVTLEGHPRSVTHGLRRRAHGPPVLSANLARSWTRTQGRCRA